MTTVLEADYGLMEDVVKESVRDFRQQSEESVPVTMRDVREFLEAGEKVERGEVMSFVEEALTLQSEILDVDLEDAEESLGSVLYDRSHHEIFESGLDYLGLSVGGISGVANTLLYSNISSDSLERLSLIGFSGLLSGIYLTGRIRGRGRYSPRQRWVGISNDRLEAQNAYWAAAAESYHLCQYENDSWTLGVPLMYEGSERAISTKALNEKAADEDESWSKAAKGFKSYVNLNGFIQYLKLEEDEPLTIYPLVEVGLTPEEADEALKNFKSGNGIEYNLGASILMSKELEEGQEVYKNVFWGDVEDRLDEFREKMSFKDKLRYRKYFMKQIAND